MEKPEKPKISQTQKKPSSGFCITQFLAFKSPRFWLSDNPESGLLITQFLGGLSSKIWLSNHPNSPKRSQKHPTAKKETL